MNTKKIIISLATTIIPVAVALADEINQTITVEREVEIVEQKVEKPYSLPEALPLKTDEVKLQFSDHTVPADFNPLLVTQTPHRRFDGFAFDNKRGYAVFGMGNYLNISGSAGYRAIATEKSQLNLWLQHNSTNGTVKDSKKKVIEDRIGAYGSHIFSAGTLSADLNYHFDKFNYYSLDNIYDRNKSQTLNEVGVNLGWLSNNDDKEGFGYHFDFGYNYLGYGDAMQAISQQVITAKGLKEHALTTTAGVEFMWDEDSHVGIDATMGYVKTINSYLCLDDANRVLYKNVANSLFSANPYYQKYADRLRLRLGARIDVASKGTTFRIAPDVKFDYSFTDRVVVALSATGGNHQNTLHEVIAHNRYAGCIQAIAPNSFTLIDAEARLNLGMWKGFSISPYFGFKITKNQLMPLIKVDNDLNNCPSAITAISGGTPYDTDDINGIKLGVDAAYKWSNIVEVKAGYRFTPQDDDSGWVTQGFERADHTITAGITVSPIKKLTINADYCYRSGRTITMILTDKTGLETRREGNMGTICDFSIGATYQINDLINVYAQGQNLFNRRYWEALGCYNQGPRFMLGAGIKF